MRLFLLLCLLASAPAGAVSVTFRVQMGEQAAQGRFDPAAQFVDVAGSFNGWDGTRLADPDGDLTYEATVGGLQPGATLAFKFRIDGLWNGDEEFPGGGPNRTYVVQSEGNVVTVWYNDEAPATGPPAAAFRGARVVLAGGVATFEDRSAGAVTRREWAFPGGTPGTAEGETVSVRYAAPGTYGVRLVASGPEGSDTLAVAGYVEVRSRTDAEPRWWNDAVFYEVFVRSFADSDGDGTGDLRGLTDRLDYLNDGDPATTDDLGVTGLWLMPVSPSPSYHGYDVTDYRGVEPDYGTLDDMRAFLDAAHARGIRVVVDYVMNHSARAHPWFQASQQGDPAYRDFYRWAPQPLNSAGPWGQAVWHRGVRGYYYGLFWGGMPDLNYEAPAVRQEMVSAADFWLQDVGVDGFRLDAAKYLFESGDRLSDTPETLAFWRDFNRHIATVADDPFTVCEAWSSSDEVVPYLLDGEMGACFEFDLAGQILGAVRSGRADRLAAKMQQIDASFPAFGVATFLTNHDQNRVMEDLGGSVPQNKAAAALYLTMPGVPFVYYGEEVGMLGRKPDEHIRRPMQWSAAPGGGFTTGQPWAPLNANYAAWNVAAQTDDPASLLSHYRRLVGARNASAALRRGQTLAVPASDAGVIAYVREDGDERVLVAVNLRGGAADALLSLPPGVFEAGTVATESLVGGAAPDLSVSAPGQAAVSLGPYEALVLRPAGAVAADDAAADDVFELRAPVPNPARGRVQIGYRVGAPGAVRVDVFDALGRRVLGLADAEAPAGAHTVSLDASRLAVGVYSVRLTRGDRAAVQRLVVTR